MYIDQWAFVGVFLLLAPLLPAAAVVAGLIFGPRKPNPLKQQTYECGVETVGDTWVQFRMQFYVYALVFLVFDVEVVFLFPWAVAYRDLGLFAFFAGLLFILPLAIDIIYSWRKGALEWT